MAFDGGHVDRGSAGWSGVVVMVVCDCKSDAVHFGFEWFQGGDDANVADGAAFGYVMEGDCGDCLGTFWSEAVKFVAPSFFPMVLVGAFDEVSVFEGVAGDGIDDGVGEESLVGLEFSWDEVIVGWCMDG